MDMEADLVVIYVDKLVLSKMDAIDVLNVNMMYVLIAIKNDLYFGVVNK